MSTGNSSHDKALGAAMNSGGQAASNAVAKSLGYSSDSRGNVYYSPPAGSPSSSTASGAQGGLSLVGGPVTNPKPTTSPAAKPAAKKTTTQTTAPPTNTKLQAALESYRNNPEAGYAEIDRAQKVYQQKMAAGDVAGANAAHAHANLVRSTMGISSQYDSATGAPINTSSDNTVTETTTPIVPEIPEEEPKPQVPQIDLMALLATYDQPLPNLEIPEFTSTTPAAMTREQALAQAEAEVSPVTRMLTDQINKLYSQTRENIPQLLNARGIAFGGSRAEAETELTDEHADKLVDLGLRQEANVNELARGLQQNSQETTRQQVADEYNRYQNTVNTGLAKWQTEASMANQNRQNKIATALALLPYTSLTKEQELSRDDKAFDQAIDLAGVTGVFNGTPTLEAKRYDLENSRITAGLTGYLNGKPTLDREALENEKAYKDESLAIDRIRASNSGSGGNNGLPGSVSERQALATATAITSGNKYYQGLVDKGYKYPLYYTISSIMNDPNQQSAFVMSGVDAKQVIDSLISTHARMSPDEYFKTAEGKKLAGSYARFSKAKAVNDPLAGL